MKMKAKTWHRQSRKRSTRVVPLRLSGRMIIILPSILTTSAIQHRTGKDGFAKNEVKSLLVPAQIPAKVLEETSAGNAPLPERQAYAFPSKQEIADDVGSSLWVEVAMEYPFIDARKYEKHNLRGRKNRMIAQDTVDTKTARNLSSTRNVTLISSTTATAEVDGETYSSISTVAVVSGMAVLLQALWACVVYRQRLAHPTHQEEEDEDEDDDDDEDENVSNNLQADPGAELDHPCDISRCESL